MYFQSAHTIRNYINPLDHVASGFVLGATYRLIGGPKAMLGNQINVIHIILKVIFCIRWNEYLLIIVLFVFD